MASLLLYVKVEYTNVIILSLCYVANEIFYSMLFFSFCATRWIEDKDVAVRALKLWPNIVKMVNHWESLCKSKRPNNKSYETLAKFHNNSLVPVRLQFFVDVSSQLKGFLELFQTDKPMVPFLEDAFSDVMRTLMKMIIKSDVLDGVSEGTSYKLIKLDLSIAENLLHYELVKLPTATKSLLKTKTIPVDKKRSFMKDCKQVLVTLLKKLQERCPLNYLICRNASSIVPYHMVTNKKRCITLFGRLVDKLFESK